MLGVLAALGLVSGLVLWDFSALLGGVAEELAAAHRHYYREEALASLATGGAVSRLGLGLGLTAALSMLSKPGTREEVLSIVLVLIGSFGMLAVAGTLHRIESGMAFLSGPFAPDSRMLAELREGITVPTSPDGMSIWQEHQVDLEDEPAGDPGEVLWIADQDTPLSTIEARFSAALQERGALSVYFLVRLAPLHEGQDSLHLSCTEGWQPSPEAPLSTLLSAGRTVQVRCEP